MEETEYARDVLRRAEEIYFVVPAIWPVEMVNVLLLKERRKRIQCSIVFECLVNSNILNIGQLSKLALR
jgi:hypothetical protein